MGTVIDFRNKPAVVEASESQETHMRRSIEYRIAASAMCRIAENVQDEERLQKMLLLAGSWVQMAENEEWLSLIP